MRIAVGVRPHDRELVSVDVGKNDEFVPLVLVAGASRDHERPWRQGERHTCSAAASASELRDGLRGLVRPARQQREASPPSAAAALAYGAGAGQPAVRASSREAWHGNAAGAR
eukprot:450011-Heterocapsa_arctica.AAC.1